MIENNIKQALGVGSGIDTQNLVKQLVEIERSAPQERIDSKREKTEAQISDFGTLANAMDTLRGSVTALTEKEGLFSKNATFSDSDALVPTKLDTNVQPGTYSFDVQSVARSQSLGFAGFSDPKSAVGEGEITFNFGSWQRDQTSGDATTFDPDIEAESFSVTIDSSNNSLQGLRDAINKADMGVQASIINDGSSYRLVMSAPSGANNELEITVNEAGGGDNTDNSGLSRFAFNTGIANFADLETQSGADAVLIVNGMTVTRESNTVEDIVEGLTLDILKEAPGETVTVTISEDKTFAEENVRGFVDAYNAFLEETQPLFGYNEEEEKDGSLANDSMAKSVLMRFRGIISSPVPGLTDSDLTSLTNIGIRTELDGTLSIDEDDFSDAFSNRFEDVQKLFSPDTHSSSPDITVNSFGNQTEAGNYDVQITQAPVRGHFAGDIGITPVLDTTGKDYSFNVSVNGVASEAISLPADVVYGSVDELAGALEAAINADSTLSEGGAAVSVAYDTDTSGFVVTSNRYGAASNVSFSGTSADFSTDFGINDGEGTAGVDVAGTIDGVAGFGLGNALLPKLGESAEGLSMIIGENATSGTVDFSRGFAGRMQETIDGFLQKNGLFDQHEETLDTRLEGLESDEERLDRRIGAYEERLMRQFIAMESILNGLNSQGGFLDNLVDTMPFTARRE